MKFIADGMLGSFSRWLRMLGYDVKYYQYMSDVTLIEIAEGEGRILLTRDKELLQRTNSKGIKAFFVDGENEAERLANIARNFRIKLEVDMSISHCPMCGATLRCVKREEVSDKVQPRTLKHYLRFWICNGCGKVYWLGRHMKKINETLEKAKTLTKRVFIK